MKVYSIDELYKICSEKYSLAKKEFCSLEDFHEIFRINNEKMLVNLMNITCAEGNKIRPKELWEVMHKLDDSKVYDDEEFLRDLREFRSLSFFLSIYPGFHFKKLKGQNPDFVLRREGKEIGLEVTSAVSQGNIEPQVSRVARSTFGRNKKTEEIQEYVRINHPNMIDKIYLDKINGATVLSPSKGLISCDAYINEIKNAALNKEDKIKNYYSQFPEMWVLMDTDDNLCFTEKHDAEKLSELFIKGDSKLVLINKIVVINIINKAYMIYDVKSHEYEFIKTEYRMV